MQQSGILIKLNAYRKKNSRRAADDSQVGDASQSLQRATYTGSCGSAMCPAVNVPKCHDERVSSGADAPISGEACPSGLCIHPSMQYDTRARGKE